jgi:hypothetical protein
MAQDSLDTDSPFPLPSSRALTRDTTPPNTGITTAPAAEVAARRATFGFVSTERNSVFECKLDRRRWQACRSPRVYAELRQGVHWFRVRARDSTGNTDPTAATRSW